VRFDAANYDPSAAPTITVNGREHAGNVIRPSDLGAGSGEIDVEVRWGLRPSVRAEAGVKSGAAAGARRD
jgi:hypothetical protein